MLAALRQAARAGLPGSAAAAPWPARPLAADLALAFGLYAVLAWAAIVVARLPGTVAVIWLANGAAMALVLSAPRERTLALLAAAALGNFAGNLAYGDPIALSAAFVLPNAAEVALGVWLVHRTGLAARFADDQASLLRVLAAGAFVPPLLGATLGAATLHTLGFAQFSRVWTDWYIGDALGTVAMLPLALALRSSQGTLALRRLLQPASLATMAWMVVATAAAIRWFPYPFVAIGVSQIVLAFTRPRLEAFAGAALTVATLALLLAFGWLTVAPEPAEHALLFAAALLCVLPAQVVAVAVARQRHLAEALTAVSGRVDTIVMLLDRSGTFRWVNRTREAYVGGAAEEVLGRRMADTAPSLLWREVLQPLFDAALQGQSGHRLVELDFPLRPGRVMDIAMQPAHDEEGHTAGVLYFATDVTDIEASRRELQRTTEALRASHQSLEQFVRIASHDLREPLNTITQFCSLLEARHEAQLDADGALYLHHVRQGAARMRQIMDDMLQYVRLDKQAPPPQRERVDLDALVQEVTHGLHALVEQRGGRIEAGPLGSVQAHRTLLALLLQNLLANALKFVPPQRAPVVRVSAVRGGDGGSLRLMVADNGIGIAPERIAELGTPFTRLHSRRAYEGTGLGLAICKRIAEQHGGALEIASVPGEGSTVTLVLPAA